MFLITSKIEVTQNWAIIISVEPGSECESMNSTNLNIQVGAKMLNKKK